MSGLPSDCCKNVFYFETKVLLWPYTDNNASIHSNYENLRPRLTTLWCDCDINSADLGRIQRLRAQFQTWPSLWKSVPSLGIFMPHAILVNWLQIQEFLWPFWALSLRIHKGENWLSRFPLPLHMASGQWCVYQPGSLPLLQIVIKKKLFVNFKGKATEKKEETKKEISLSADSLLQSGSGPGLVLELHLGCPHKWQGLKCLGHLLLSLVHLQGVGLGTEQLGLESAHVWNADIASCGLIHW